MINVSFCSKNTLEKVGHRPPPLNFFYSSRERGVYEISVRSMNIDDRPTDRRPTDQPTNYRPQGPFTYFGKISNDHISATRQPIPFTFSSRWGFRGRRIERRHFQLDQIQDGGRQPSWKTSNGHISAMRYPIYCMYANHTLPSVS